MKKEHLISIFSMMLYLLYGTSVRAQDTIAPGPAVADTTIINSGRSNLQVGYGSQDRNKVTAAISTVEGSTLEKNFTLNAGNTLFGRLAGLTVSQGNSEPGAGVPSLLVRGRNTFGVNASSEPLVIIDGLISNGYNTANAFMQLQPEEIESVSVLKDAAATAIYGMRAANGVLLVTTRTGKEGALKVSFTTKHGFNQARYIPESLDSYNYGLLYNEALQNDGLPARYSEADLNAYKDRSDPIYHPDVNWYNEVLRPLAGVSSYDLTFSGGDPSVRYFVMLNALNSQGLYKKFGDDDEESSNSKFTRYNFRSNIDITLSRRLKAAFKIAGSLEQISNPFAYNTASTFSFLATLPPNAFPVYNTDGSYGGNTTYTQGNPVANLRSTGFFQTNARTILTSLKLTQQLDAITKGLSVSGVISINNYFKSGSRKTKQYPRYTAVKTPGGEDITVLVPGSQLTSLAGTEQTLDQYRNFIVQAFLDYQRTFGKSDVSGMLMFNKDNITFNAPPSDPTVPSANSTDPYKHNNGAGRLTYTYNDRYTGQFSFAYMGSDLFPKDRRYGFFPAGSVGWVASNEDFLQGSRQLNFLKLRASYGIVGNDNTIVPPSLSTRYAFTGTFGGGGYFFGTSNVPANGFAENVIANPNITWEKEKYLNIGFDATLFDHFSLSFDVFDRDRYDILVPSNSTTPLFLGVNTQNLNKGRSNNKGFDLSLEYSKNTRRGWQFYVQANVSYARNKVLFNAESLQINSQLYSTGGIIGQPLVYKFIGFYTQEDIDRRLADPKSVPAVLTETIRAGDLKYQDTGGPEGKPDGIIDGNDLMPIGKNAIPDLQVGLRGGFRYKSFDLDLVLQGVSGNTAYLGGSYFNAFQNNGTVSPIALGRWTPETAGSATYPRLSSRNNLNNFLGSSFWQRDGSFIKLRSAEIGYSLPLKISDKIKATTIRIFANGTNLFSLDHIEYGDPESPSGYPVTRTVTLGAKIQL